MGASCALQAWHRRRRCQEGARVQARVMSRGLVLVLKRAGGINDGERRFVMILHAREFRIALLVLVILAGLCVRALGAERGTTREMIVAGGCFWCVEADFESVDGVGDVISGFTGGHTPTRPTPQRAPAITRRCASPSTRIGSVTAPCSTCSSAPSTRPIRAGSSAIAGPATARPSSSGPRRSTRSRKPPGPTPRPHLAGDRHADPGSRGILPGR